MGTFLSSLNATSRSRRTLFCLVLLLVSVSITYPLIHFTPLEVFYYTFAPAPSPQPSQHPSYPAYIPVPHVQIGPNQHPIENGLLKVNMTLPAVNHPIYQLVKEAKRNWVEKNERQSTTLEQAVNEYKKRHQGRNPPKGFDHWWAFVQKNNVSLPDEYDRIMIDLGPFKGFSPSTLRARTQALQTVKGTFSIKNVNGVLSIHSANYDHSIGGADARAQGQFNLIKEVAQYIPDFDACYSIEDTPTQFVSWAHMRELKALAEEEEYFGADDEADRAFSDWGAACPPHTALWQSSISHALHPGYNSSSKEQYVDDPHLILAPGYRPNHFQPADLKAPLPPPLGTQKSFVADHVATMDLCVHNESVRLHGAMNGLHPVPAAHLMPIFSLSKTNLHGDIMVIPIEQWGEDGGALNWKDKDETRVLWRGRNTGGMYTVETPWRSSHRARLARMASDHLQSTIEIIPSPKWIERNKFIPIPPPQEEPPAQDDASDKKPTAVVGGSAVIEDEKTKGGKGRLADALDEEAKGDARRGTKRRRKHKTYERRESEEGDFRPMQDVILGVNQGAMNQAMLDVGLAYEPIQCSHEDGTCDAVKRELTFREVKTFSQENHYRYIIDIDGNAWSARFKRQLTSNAMVIKSTVFPEWWNDRIQPWLHYVPMKLDFSDLYDIMAFFQGDGREFKGEEQMAQAIAENGRHWSITSWRREDMTAYMFRLYLEWARLVADDRSSMDFVLPA